MRGRTQHADTRYLAGFASLRQIEVRLDMEDNRPAVLIAEDQIFIALELERIFVETADWFVETCRRSQLAKMLTARPYDLVVLEFTSDAVRNLELSTLVGAHGADLAFLCSTDDLERAKRELPRMPIIEKPFFEPDVAALVRRYLESKMPPPAVDETEGA